MKRSNKRSKQNYSSRRKRLSGGLENIDRMVSVRAIVPYVTCFKYFNNSIGLYRAEVLHGYREIMKKVFFPRPRMNTQNVKTFSSLMNMYALSTGSVSGLRTQIQVSQVILGSTDYGYISSRNKAYIFDEEGNEQFSFTFGEDNPNVMTAKGYAIVTYVIVDLYCRESLTNKYFLSKYVTNALNEMLGFTESKFNALKDTYFLDEIENLTLVIAQNQFEQVQNNTVVMIRS